MNKLDLDNIFTYHSSKGDQAARYHELRSSGYGLAEMILNYCPESREKSIALTKVQEAIMWANASIAINERD